MASAPEHRQDSFLSFDTELGLLLASNPVGTIDQLLFGRLGFSRGEIQASDHIVRRASSGDSEIDAALATWVERAWPPVPSDSLPTRRIARAWEQVGLAVFGTASLTRTHHVLRARFDSRFEALDWMSEGPASDPLASYLLALARRQRDASLADEWWELCSMSAGQPWHRALVGITGLAHLPAGPTGVEGGFPQAVVPGSLLLGRALAAAVRDGTMAEASARAHFVSVGRRLERWYPLPERWAEILLDLATERAALPPGWLDAAFPHAAIAMAALEQSDAVPRIARPHSRRNPDWAQQARAAAEAIRRRGAAATKPAEELLHDQRQHAQSTGDAEPLVQSLGYFADRMLRHDAATALGWVDEGRRWEPGNQAIWNTLVRAHLVLEDGEGAADAAFILLERFPADHRSYSQVGHVMTSLGATSIAVLAHQLGMTRFPQNPYHWTGLALAYLGEGRFDEAEAVYLDGIERFEENPVLQLQYGLFLASQDRELPAARTFIEQAVAAGLKDARGPNALRTLATGGSVSIPKGAHTFSGTWRPDGLTTLRMHRLERNARSLGIAVPEGLPVDGIQSSDPAIQALAAAESTLTTLADGDWGGAVQLATAASAMFPGSIPVAFAVVKAGREQGRSQAARYGSEVAEALLRDLTRFTSLRAADGVVQDLTRLQTLAALVDGAALDDDVVRTYRSFVLRTGRQEGRFGDWLHQRLIADGLLVDDAGAPDVRRQLDSHKAITNDLEEAMIFALS